MAIGKIQNSITQDRGGGCNGLERKVSSLLRKWLKKIIISFVFFSPKLSEKKKIMVPIFLYAELQGLVGRKGKSFLKILLNNLKSTVFCNF